MPVEAPPGNTSAAIVPPLSVTGLPFGRPHVSFHAADSGDEAVPCPTVSTDAATASSPPTRRTTTTWAARLAWVAVTLTGAVCVDRALSGADDVAQVLVPVVWWVLVAGTVLALVVPAPSGLTAVRATTPLAVAVAVGSLVAGADAVWATTFLAASILATGITLSAEFAAEMVQGSAYGSEQRFPLRPPVAVLLPVVVTWAAWAASVVAGVVLLAHSVWIPGVALVVVAVGAAVVLFPRFDRLAERWLVLVPAGVVVHDPLVLAETLMVQRPAIRRIGLAPADTEAADLSGPAAGHLIEVGLRDMALAVFAADHANPRGRAIHVQSYLVAPSRPGRALAAMASARLPVG